MASSRQERHLMRQRGAGVRELKNASFGFTFGAPPLQPRSSSRRTPVPLEPRPSSRKTPTPLPPRRSSRKTLVAPSSQRSVRARRTSSKNDERPSSRSEATASGKKTATSSLTLGLNNERPASKTPTEGRFVTPTLTGKRKRALPSSEALQAIEEDELGQGADVARSSSRRSRSMSSRLSQRPVRPTESVMEQLERLQSAVDEINELRGSQSEWRTRSMSQTLAQAPDTEQRLTQPSGQVNAEHPSELVKSSLTRRSTSRMGSEASNVTRQHVQNMRDDSDHQQSEDLRPPSKKKAKRDVSGEPTAADGQASSGESQNIFVSENEDEPSVARRRPAAPQELSSVRQSVQRTAPRPRRLLKGQISQGKENETVSKLKGQVTSAPPMHEDKGGLNEDSDAVANSSEGQENIDPGPSTGQKPHSNAQGRKRPANGTTRARKKPRAPKATSNVPPQDSEPADSKVTVPITVYRLSQPTSTHPDASTDEPVPSSTLPYTRRAGVNPVDVLAQVASEIITRFAEARPTLQPDPASSSSSSSSAALKRRRAIVLDYGAELSDRLFELTTALDANAALQKRVRAAVKEKAALREDLLQLRRERDVVALRMDEVRARHAAAMKGVLAKQELSAMVHDVGLAVQRGRVHARESGREHECPEKGLGMLLEDVVGRVGGKDSGVLGRVKRFNALLQGAANVIEGRA